MPSPWNWPKDVYVLRERFIADAVASVIRHRAVNDLTRLTNATFLLKRSMAQPSAEQSAKLEQISRAVGDATTALRMRFASPSEEGSMRPLNLRAELDRLVAETEASVRIVRVDDLTAEPRVTVPLFELRVTLASLLEAALPDTEAGQTLRVSLSSRPDSVELRVQVGEAPHESEGSSTQELSTLRQLWLEVARRVVGRLGGHITDNAPIHETTMTLPRVS